MAIKKLVLRKEPGTVVKVTRRKTNTSTYVLLTINKDTELVIENFEQPAIFSPIGAQTNVQPTYRKRSVARSMSFIRPGRTHFEAAAPPAPAPAPTVVSSTIQPAGNVIHILLSDTTSVGTGGSAGLSFSLTGGAVLGTYISGSGTNTLVYSLSRVVYSTETGTYNYTQPGNGWEGTSGGTDVASFNIAPITNNSTQTPAAPLVTAVTIPAAGTFVNITYDSLVVFGSGGNSGHTLSMSGGASIMTYSSGSGTNTLNYSLSRVIQSGETGTLAYTQPGNGVESSTSFADVASYSGRSVTNNSTAGTINPQEADWIARSTQAGVTAAYDFRDASIISSYRHIDGQQGNIVQNTTGGILGTGCMRMNVPASSGANPGAWRAPLDLATAPNYQGWTADSDGFNNTEFYFQYRIKLGPRRLRDSTGGGGFKTMILSIYQFSSPNSAASAQPFEIVHNTNYSNNKLLQAYRQDGSGFPAFHETIGPYLRFQPALDWGSSLPDDRRYSVYNIGGGGRHSAGVLAWEEGVWITVYCRVKIATYGGSTGNEFDMYVAWPGDSSYTQLYNNRNFLIGPKDAQFAGGFNGIWFTPYDTGRSSADYDTWHEYDQLIVSTQPIACPLAQETVPSWFSSQTSKTWTTPVTNTLSSVYVPSTGGFSVGSNGNGLYAWSSGVAHRSRRALRFFGGGHGDNDVNSVFEVQLATTSPVWAKLNGPSSSAGGSVNEGVYGDGQPRSPHSWRQLVDVPHSGTWMAPLPGTYNTGFNSGRFFNFDDTALSWAARGYRPGTSASTGLGDANTLGSSEYDSYTGLIYVSASQGVFWTIDPVTYTATLTGASNDTNYYFSGGLSPQRRAFVLWKQSTNQFRVLNIAAGTLHTPTIQGTGPSGSNIPGMVWHEPSGGFLAWGHSGTTTSIFKLTPPSNGADTFTGAWTWSTVTVDASNAITPSSAGSAPIIPTVKIIPNFGGLRSDLLVVYGATGSGTDQVYCYKLPVGGV